MKRFLIGLLAINIIMVSCKPKAEEQKPEEAAGTVRKVKVMKLEKKMVSNVLEYSANLEAKEKIHLAPSTPGKIEKIYVEVGDFVKKGQLVISMDRYQLDVARLNYEQSKNDFVRYDTVYKAGAVASSNFEKAKMAYEVSKTQYEYLLRNTDIKAPFDGVVTGKYFEDGELYSSAPNTADGKAAIVTLNQVNPCKALLEIPEQYYMQVSKGLVVELAVSVYPEEAFKGYVETKYPVVDEKSRNFKVEVIIPNPGNKLKPGMFTKASLKLGNVEAFVVPATVVLKQDGSNERYVFAYKDGKAQRISVQLGRRFNENIEIISTEIDENTQLIYSGHVNLYNNSEVELVKE